MWIKNFQMYNLDLEKAEELEIKLPTSIGSREFQKTLHFCFIDYAKAFDCVDHNIVWKILKKTGIPDHLTYITWETCMQVKKQQLQLDMEQWIGSKLGKGYVKAVYCHAAYLASVQSSVLCWVAQSCPTLCNPMDCSPGSSVHGDSPGKILE